MTTTYYRHRQQSRDGSCYYASVHHKRYYHPSSAAAPAPLPDVIGEGPCCACGGAAVDGLICDSAIAQALSERSIFGPFSLPVAIHMPAPNKHTADTQQHRHHHSRFRPPSSLITPAVLSNSNHFWPEFADDHDPLQATTREPWDSHCEETMEEEEQQQQQQVKQEPVATATVVSSSSDDDHHPYFFVHHHQQPQYHSTIQTHHPHTYYDTGRTDLMDHDPLHRRASTISDTITTSSTEISRRFSNTSSILTDASSVDPEEEKDKVVEEDEEEWQPVWADPARVRDNPSRYERVQAYMKQHGIAPDSPMPLSSAYTFYFWDSSSNQKTSSLSSTSAAANHYMQAVKPIFDCTTVWDFSSRWRRYKVLRGRPGQMLPNQNLYCFIKGVQPMWEDVRNSQGGRLTLSPTRNDLDEVFEWILASFVGGNLEPYGMVGMVLSRRTRGDRVELWLERSAPEDVPGLKTRLCQHLAAPFHDLVMGARFKKHFDSK